MDQKASLRIVLGMITASMVFYSVIGLWIVSGRSGRAAFEVPALVTIFLGVVALAGASAIAQVAAVPHNSPQRFRSLAFVAAAVLDGAALAGVVITILSWQIWPTVLLTLVGVLGVAAFVLPATNAWFRAREGAADVRTPHEPS